MIRALAFVVLLFVTLLFSWAFAPLHFLWCTFGALTKRNEYTRRAFLGYDQGFNAILAPVLNVIFPGLPVPFGDEDRTISGTIGRNLRDHRGQSPRAFFILNHWLTEIDPHSSNHCVDSIEPGEN